MKPLLHTPKRARLRGREMPTGSRRPQPFIDYHYYTGSGDFRRSNRFKVPWSSFRRLSTGLLTAEIKREYLIEAICFVIFACVSAWPIAIMVHAFSFLK